MNSITIMQRKESLYKHVVEFVSGTPKWVLVLCWATATGKTGLSIALGTWMKEHDLPPLEIISADSRQIYRYMDIGTDKINLEQRKGITHYMLDIVDPDETYTAWQRKQSVEHHIAEIHARGHVPCVVGWTWLYIDMVYKNFSMPDVAPDRDWRDTMWQKERDNPWFLYTQLQHIDPEEAMKHHPNSTRYILRALEIFHKTWQKKSVLAQEQPVKWPLYMIGLWREKEDTNRRINARIKEMMASDGLVQENRKLLAMGYTLEHTAMNGIGYKEVIGYIQEEYDKDRCIELLKRNTHRYAKRQRSWFRRYITDMKARPKEWVKYEVIEL